jgi:hypothetical protein
VSTNSDKGKDQGTEATGSQNEGVDESPLSEEALFSLEMDFGTGINKKVILVTKGMTLKELYKFSKRASPYDS